MSIAASAVFSSGVGFCQAAKFTADLQLTPATSPYGQYLTATYDFGTALAVVESVRLQLDIPEGFEATFATTGNSSWSWYFAMQIHHPADPPPADDLTGRLFASPLSIPPSAAAEVAFNRLQIGGNWQVFDASWPDFLFSGAGSVSFIDVRSSYYHPLPGSEVVHSTTNWLIPDELLGARLIVEGTAVPEPAAWTLFGLTVFGMTATARKKSAALL